MEEIIPKKNMASNAWKGIRISIESNESKPMIFNMRTIGIQIVYWFMYYKRNDFYSTCKLLVSFLNLKEFLLLKSFYA